MIQHEPVPLEDVMIARKLVAEAAIRTPLMPLNVETDATRIFLKLENLQPIGSFKLRGASNFLGLADRQQLSNGVWTASAGNMAQGVAWCARRLGLECSVLVPEHAPITKRAAIQRLGARIVDVPFAQWLEVFRTQEHAAMKGLFVPAFSSAAVMVGNGTIALEILEDLPDVDAVIVPYGGGGLSCGIASVVRAMSPDTKVYACEVDTAAPLAASLVADKPVEVEYTASFVDGIGAPHVYPEMFDLARKLLDGSLVVPLEEVAAAVRLLIERNHVVAEGAGAAPVAAALAGLAGEGNVVCVVSGGNIDSAKLREILAD